MSMIYPLDHAMENLMATLIDPETGEMLCSEEEMNEAIVALEMDFDNKIAALRNSFLDTELDAKRAAAEAKVLREEAANIQKRANSLQNRADRIKRFIAYLLQGEKYEKDGVRISYRKSEEVVFEDRFLTWAKQNRPELLDMKIKKADVKAAIKNGDKLSYAHIEERSNIQIR